MDNTHPAWVLRADNSSFFPSKQRTEISEIGRTFRRVSAAKYDANFSSIAHLPRWESFAQPLAVARSPHFRARNPNICARAKQNCHVKVTNKVTLTHSSAIPRPRQPLQRSRLRFRSWKKGLQLKCSSGCRKKIPRKSEKEESCRDLFTITTQRFGVVEQRFLNISWETLKWKSFLCVTLAMNSRTQRNPSTVERKWRNRRCQHHKPQGRLVDERKKMNFDFTNTEGQTIFSTPISLSSAFLGENTRGLGIVFVNFDLEVTIFGSQSLHHFNSVSEADKWKERGNG